MRATFELDQFPSRARVELQQRDTDHLGHVNHAVFISLLETGRIEIFIKKAVSLPSEGCGLVLVSININFLAEVFWPGSVEIGTRLAKIGRSSITVEQAIFQNGRCCATGITVTAQMNTTTRRAQALDEIAVEHLKVFLVSNERL